MDTPPLRIDAARVEDHAAIGRLLDGADLRTSDLTPAMLQDFLVAREGGRIAGTVGLEIAGDIALLRSLVVVPDSRARGIGVALTDAAERHAVRRGVTRLFLLTTTAADFFRARGYAAIERDEAPPAIRSTAQFSTLCPASSTFMAKSP